MAPQVQPPHIGILCDYGFTLLPKSGIGVFVYNLIDGLLTLSPCPEITLLTHPGDQEDLEECAQRWGPRVRILPPFEDSKKVAARLGRRLRRWHERSLHLEDVLCIRWDDGARLFKRRALCGLKEEWKNCRSLGGARKSFLAWSFTKMVFWLVLLGAGSWAAEILSSLLLVFLVPTLAFPIRLGHRIFQKLQGAALPLESRMSAAACDVWLVPFPGTETPILAPHVLVIFDMVFRHVPEVYSASKRDHFERVFAARAREATLIYCGSNFVKDHDLVPSFPFAADRIRVFRLAPPMDLQCGAEPADLDSLRRKYGIGSQFLFYPAALRAHKNHAMLVRALSLLHRQYGLSALELVFTGEDRQTSDLLPLVQNEGLSRYVHFLGVISRQEIQALYKHALLVPLPSLHEGYGLPLLEALQNECPVACADIPAFRELLEESSEGVLFFDPRDPASLANAISLTIARRDEFRERQRDAYRQIARRDWHAVAQDFLHIFEEAYHLSSGRQQPATVTLESPQETIRNVA